MNGNHQGAAPQRDFLLMTPAGEDRELNAAPNLDALMAMSRKASLTPHPAVLSFRKADADSPGFSQQGDSDWVLQSKVGDTPIAVVVAGAARRLETPAILQGAPTGWWCYPGISHSSPARSCQRRRS